MIEIKNLSHSLGGNKILENVNLEIPDGCIMGLVGINGAGKTTLLRLLSGVYKPDSGEILYNGSENPQNEKTREKIFFLADDPYYTMSSTGDSIFKLYKTLYPTADTTLFDSILNKYNLNKKKPLRNFSKGMRRQVFVALAMAIKPDYLLLDEAFDGLDPLARKQFRDTINQYVEENDTTVIISSHSLRELEDFCDMYALIDNHTVSSSGDISERVSNLHKYQLAFAGEVPIKLLEAIPASYLEINGKFVQIILDADKDTIEAILKSLNPTVMDEMKMNFEETFIYDVTTKKGDRK